MKHGNRENAVSDKKFSNDRNQKNKSGITRRNFMLGTLSGALSLAFMGTGLVKPAQAKYFYPDIRPGYGVTGQTWLSTYMPALKNTNLDTPVFFLDSGKPGACALLIGGTHCNEIAAQTAALLMVENACIKKGKLIVIPVANRSGLSQNDTKNHIAHLHPIETKSGTRQLVYGDRRTDPKDHKKPDGDCFIHPSGYKNDDPREARNLNRNYPGLKDGSPTQQLAYGIINLIRKENVDFCLDCHEASTPDGKPIKIKNQTKKSGRLAYTLVSHPKGTEIAASAILDLEEDTNMTLKLEESRAGFRGLSHLEIGNATPCISFLSESPNPGQDWEAVNAKVINHPKYPLAHRVGLHLRLFTHLANNYELMHDKPLVIENMPTYKQLMKNKVGAYLN